MVAFRQRAIFTTALALTAGSLWLLSAEVDYLRFSADAAVSDKLARRPAHFPLERRQPEDMLLSQQDNLAAVSEDEKDHGHGRDEDNRALSMGDSYDETDDMDAMEDEYDEAVAMVPLSQVMASCQNVQRLLDLDQLEQEVVQPLQQLFADLDRLETCLQLSDEQLARLASITPLASPGSARSVFLLCELFLCIVAATSTTTSMAHHASAQISNLAHALTDEQMYHTGRYRLYLRELARAQVRRPGNACTRGWGGTTSYLASGVYGFTYVRCLFEQHCLEHPRTVIKMASTQSYLGKRSSQTLAQGFDASVESHTLEITRALVESTLIVV